MRNETGRFLAVQLTRSVVREKADLPYRHGSYDVIARNMCYFVKKTDCSWFMDYRHDISLHQ